MADTDNLIGVQGVSGLKLLLWSSPCMKNCHDNLMYDSVLSFGIARDNRIVGEAVQELPSFASCQTNESQDDGVASNCRRVFVVSSSLNSHST